MVRAERCVDYEAAPYGYFRFLGMLIRVTLTPRFPPLCWCQSGSVAVPCCAVGRLQPSGESSPPPSPPPPRCERGGSGAARRATAEEFFPGPVGWGVPPPAPCPCRSPLEPFPSRWPRPFLLSSAPPHRCVESRERWGSAPSPSSPHL